MHPHDRWDSLIRFWVGQVWPDLEWRLIKAQAIVESGMDPRAVSPKGARGLLQLMPETATEMGCEDPFDPEQNLRAGIRYLRDQYRHFPEIPDTDERIRFALAAYSCGRAYINRALEIYYEEEFGEPMPPGHRGARPGNWQRWECASVALLYDRCRVNGRMCRYEEVLRYVRDVWALYRKMRDEAQRG
jgi:hypothetical protein